MLVSISLLVFLIWMVLFFAWGNFWRVWEFDSDHAQFLAPAKWPRVGAVIPARNEAASIEKVVQSLALQEYAGEFSIVVVDDHSDDDTAELARRTAERAGAASRVRIVSAPELASEWTGKLWALNAGVANFCSADNPVCAPIVTLPGTAPPNPITNPPEFFWFTDADVVRQLLRLELRLIGRCRRLRLRRQCGDG